MTAGLDAAVTRRDRAVHRCGQCGTWLYAERPCLTCQALDRQLVERGDDDDERETR